MRSNNPLTDHLGIKSIFSVAVVCVSQVLAIILGFAFKDNPPSLIACLVLIHVIEILALSYLILNIALAVRKNEKLKFIWAFLISFILLLAIACYLEAYLIQ